MFEYEVNWRCPACGSDVVVSSGVPIKFVKCPSCNTGFSLAQIDSWKSTTPFVRMKGESVRINWKNVL